MIEISTFQHQTHTRRPGDLSRPHLGDPARPAHRADRPERRGKVIAIQADHR